MKTWEDIQPGKKWINKFSKYIKYSKNPDINRPIEILCYGLREMCQWQIFEGVFDGDKFISEDTEFPSDGRVTYWRYL